jgi:hypothetical protein
MKIEYWIAFSDRQARTLRETRVAHEWQFEFPTLFWMSQFVLCFDSIAVNLSLLITINDINK